MNALLGAYGDSDAESNEAEPAPAAAEVKSNSTQASAGGKRPAAGAKQQEEEEAHGVTCDCDDCGSLLQRYVAKNIQTKGIRFKCRLCGDQMSTKAHSVVHFQTSLHAVEVQDFKRQKHPQLFEVARRKAAAKAEAIRKQAFSREAVLQKKRPADDDASFGGWAKKEKPEPPPIQQPEYQDEVEKQQEVLTIPPWQLGQRPSNEGASAMDKEVDGHICQAQQRRFCKRNVMELNPTQARCKLCFKIIGTAVQTENHVLEAHQEDFAKEIKIWERFLFTVSKRQPPFGWVCKVCNTFFPTDGDTWRHVGKEVFIRREERHMGQWHEKEDRWGHEEDEECCGDGMNSRGLSYDSVLKYQEVVRKEEAEREVKSMGLSKPGEESDDEEEAEPAADAGQVKFVTEF
mmetsp:Transcript_23420/g.51403  ORF Transcript_23420/g.51403 Transcript_23420/m.51403 type:complete len:402 (+) Transcript_23420:49-1254(+)